MKGLIKRVTNQAVREWYEKDKRLSRQVSSFGHTRFDLIARTAINKGYVFNPDSGLFSRPLFSSDEIKKALDYTAIDILFPRPVDLHQHNDLPEAIRVINGDGIILYTENEESNLKKQRLVPGQEIYIEKKVAHTFIPFGLYVEIRVFCPKVLKPDEEICLIPFNEFEPWQKYVQSFGKYELPEVLTS